MRYETYTLNISSNKEEEMINVTSNIRKVLSDSKIDTGKITLYVPHTTAAVTINENADPDVKRDMLYGLSKTFPKDKNYQHYEGNSHAHIKSSVIGVDQALLVQNNTLLLGTWQGVYFMEFDGPRSRKLIIRIGGE